MNTDIKITLGLFWLCIGLLGLTACRSEDPENTAGFDLTEWTLLGPLPVDAEQDPYDADAASLVGLEESLLVARGLANTLDEAPADSLYAQHPDAFGVRLSETVYVDFYNQFGMQASRDEVQPVAFAETTLAVDEAQSVYLLIASSAGPVVWLNGELIYQQPVSRSLFPYDDAIRIDLHKGENRLLFKVPRLRHHWGLRVRAEPNLQDAIDHALSEQASLQSFLWAGAVWTPGEGVELRPRGVPPGAELDFRLERSDAEVVHEFTARAGEYWMIPGFLEEGLYRSVVSANAKDYYEWVFVGGLMESAATRLEEARRVLSENGNVNDRVLLERIAIMLETASSVWQAQRNLIYTLAELEQVLRSYGLDEDPYRDRTGLQIRGFVSDIDSQDQAYRLYLPSGYDPDGDGTLPMVVLLPARTYEERPFIRSVYMAGIVDAERMAAIAEANQVALLWSGFRNNLARQPCEVTHLREVLANVESHYRIDPGRITLLGGCSGAGLSIDAIAAMPERFAGIGWMNPMYGFERNFPSERAFGRFPAYQEWRRSVDGFDAIFETGGPPIVIVHDGGEPGHGELHVAMRFVNEARANDYPVELLRVHQTWSEHYGALRQLVEMLAQMRRDQNPTASNEAQPSLVATPTVFDVFADSFTVVSGTAGSGSDEAQMNRLVAEFEQSWQAMHFAECRVETDAELTDLDQNLLILGSPHHNRTAAELALDELVDPEDGPLVYEVLRNPLFPERLILWIRADELAHIRLDRPALPEEGWFRKAIWRTDATGPRLLAIE
ncbi:MAG: hypothetical protein JJU20_07740 [Opitutales bacterium]|nr:hypothetical protein [Opitutales bacterium]